MNKISEQIQFLIDEQYRDPNFTRFSSNLRELGIIYFIFNTMTNNLSFYTSEGFLHSSFQKNIADIQTKEDWTLGSYLDKKSLEKAIAEIESGAMDSVTFHRMAHAAGVIMSIVYLLPQKIYYFGQDGEFYIENYS